jgi:hypothetical protein
MVSKKICVTINKMNKNVFFLYFFLIISCLNNNSRMPYIDRFLKEFRNEDFSDFEQFSIIYRGIDFKGGIIYMVGKSGKTPSYFVTYNSELKTIIEVKRNEFVDVNSEIFLNDDELFKLVSKFNKYRIGSIRINNGGDIFIHPFNFEDNQIIVRFKIPPITDTIKVGTQGLFKHLLDNWFLQI